MAARILFLTFELPPEIPGGIATVARDKIRAFGDRGYSLTVVGPSNRFRLSRPELSAGFLPIPVRKNGLKFATMLLWALFAALFQRPRFVYAMSGTYSGMVAHTVSRLFGLSYFVMAHGNEFLRFEHSGRTKALIEQVYRKASSVFAVSNYTARELIRIYGIEPWRVQVTYNGVDAARFAPADTSSVRQARGELGLPEGALFLLTVSRVDKRKNHSAVIDALARLLDWGLPRSQVRYLIGGTGPHLDAVKHHVARLGLNDVVQFLGFVLEKDLATLYTMADIFVMPSILLPDVGSVEGFGLVYVEAGLCGTPSIGGVAGGVSDAIVHEKTGYIVDGTDSAAVATAILAALDGREHLEAMGVAAREHYLATYTLDRVISRELAFINDRLHGVA